MTTILEKPTKAEQRFAQEAMSGLEKIAGKKKTAFHVYFSIRLDEKEESLEAPTYVIRYLKFLLGNMAEGKAVKVLSVETELSTQEAADILGVSRPFVVKLLEQGKIPFKKVGTHRRIELKDIQVYEKKLRMLREKHLNFLSKQAQELNLGYEL